jgi:hypothetical protein
MNRAVLQACLPWLALLAALVVVAALLVRLCGSRPRLSRLFRLHADQDGGSQSLSFVLTLPAFAFTVLAIVDVSQVTIGTMVVNYAAFAAARAAIVWIPAQVGDSSGYVSEAANCLNGLDNSSATSDAAGGAPVAEGGTTFPDIPTSFSGSAKFDKIRLAAAMACTPICPSVAISLNLGGASQGGASQGSPFDTLSIQTTGATVSSAQNVYVPLAANSQLGQPAAAQGVEDTRLQNKIAYALAPVTDSSGNAIPNPDSTSPGLVTWVGLQVFHPYIEPPLAEMAWPADITNVLQNYTAYYQPNEIGWRDAVTATVQHRMALMIMVPGAGKVLSMFLGGLQQVTLPGTKTPVWVVPLIASATLGVEGDKSQVPYVYSTASAQ